MMAANWKELAQLVIIMEDLGDNYAKIESECPEKVMKKYMKLLAFFHGNIIRIMRKEKDVFKMFLNAFRQNKIENI